jgi:pyruvate dehydrogenase E2 component (dihydrolipoamide acetyltransferase)
MTMTLTKDFMVPDLGEGLEELTVVTWLIGPGGAVALNEPLCIVETAKAEVEIPSPFGGILVSHGGAEGDTLHVGSLLASFAIDEPDLATSTDIGPAAEGAAGDPRPEPTLVGYGHDKSIDRSRRRDWSAAAPPVTADVQISAVGARPRARPPVRKLARDRGVDLAALGSGTGPSGIITREDVLRAAERSTSTPAPGTSTSEVVAVRGVRARIAERMTTSRQLIPDATCSVVVDCTRLLALRVALNEAATAGGKQAPITPFALLCRLAVHALRAAPVLNATFDESVPEIRINHSVHLGIGTATDRGLLVAVVRDADRRSTRDLALEMTRLTEAARAGTLPPTDMVGSTITVSNFGALGLDEGIPVINHPEAAILGVGSMRPRPHVVDGDLAVRTTCSLTLAFDHRVGDGADAGRFLTELRKLVEAPDLLLLDA